MVLYLAGLKSVDPTLREAAAIDGANQRQTFFRVVFPVMRPINIVIIVITVIESLRAFDIAYIINRGKNGLELLSILITNNSLSEASLIGFGIGDRGGAAGDLAGPDHDLPRAHVTLVGGGPDMTAVATPAPVAVRRTKRIRWQRVALHLFLITLALVWLFPLAVDRVHGAPAVQRHRRAGRLRLDREDAHARQLHLRLERGGAAAELPEHADRRRAGRDRHAVRLVDAGVRLLAVQLQG